MTSKKRSRLGKGLGALLGDVTQAVSEEPIQDRSSAATESYRRLSIDQLQPGKNQPRQHIDKQALAELATSIEKQGVVQPILVRQLKKDGQYEIIAGERRWRAAQLAGLQQLPAVVRDISDQTAIAVGLIENMQREDLNPIEEAVGLNRLLQEFGLTHQEISESIGRSRTAVTNLLRLLSLHPDASELVQQNKLDMGHARALLALPDAQQPAVAQRVADADMSVRATEQLVKRLLNTEKKPGPRIDQDIRDLQQQISERLNARVTIKHKGKKGKLIIDYHSLDELDGIIERLQ